MDIKEITKIFNQARELYQNITFRNSEKFYQFMTKNFGLKKNRYVINELYKLLEDGKFPSSPVYIRVIEKAVNNARKIRKVHNHNYLFSKKKSADKQSPITEEEAIKLLKILGYKIYKPETKYTEV